MKKINYRNTSGILALIIIMIALLIIAYYSFFYDKDYTRGSPKVLSVILIIVDCFLMHDLIIAIKSKCYYEFFDDKITNFMTTNPDLKTFNLKNIKFATRVIISEVNFNSGYDKYLGKSAWYILRKAEFAGLVFMIIRYIWFLFLGFIQFFIKLIFIKDYLSVWNKNIVIFFDDNTYLNITIDNLDDYEFITNYFLEHNIEFKDKAKLLQIGFNDWNAPENSTNEYIIPLIITFVILGIVYFIKSHSG